MSIARKPKAANKQFINTGNEKQVSDFINQGGNPTPKNENKKESNLKNVQLRLEVDLIGQIDKTLESRIPRCSRHNWILEAIFEKLENDK